MQPPSVEMLDLEVQPERSLGNDQLEFLLGMPFNQAITVLKRFDKTIKGVQVLYNEQCPLLTDLVINLSQDGIRLVFDSNSQQLKVIEIYNMCQVKLSYCGSVFNSPTVDPSVDQISQSFGATHPGVYKADKQIFVLSFRGLSFEFKVDSKHEALRFSPGIGGLQFMAGSTPTVSRMFIYTGSCIEKTRAPSLPLTCYHGNCHLDRVDALTCHGVTDGLRFSLVFEGNRSVSISDSKQIKHEAVVRFGDTCQDVLSALGCPAKVFYKEEDKMKIHTPVAHKTAVKSRLTDYFFNYFTLGVDILFDAMSLRVKKFILHTNFPGHYNFNIYYRCKFSIPLPLSIKSSSRSSTEVKDIHYDSKWHSIQSLLIAPNRRPVVLQRISTTNTVNPFGSTYCHGANNMIFEVMPNDHIAAITICQPKSQSKPITKHP